MIKCRTTRTEEFFESPGHGQPLLIAEAGVGHFGDVERGFKLIDLASESRFDVVKFQHFDIDGLVSRSYSPEWYNRLSSRTLTDGQLIQLAEYSASKDIGFACTAHEPKALAFLMKNFDLPFLKFGSGEWRTSELLEIGSQSSLPLLISTGMHSDDDVKKVVTLVGDFGIRLRVILLNCVTSYPTPLSELNMGYLRDQIDLGEMLWGHSDHCASEVGCFAAIALGARVIERHISLERDVPNAQDWKVSTFAESAIQFVKTCRDLARAIDCYQKPLMNETAGREWACKSPYFADTLKLGDRITNDCVKFLRPYQGVSQAEFLEAIGAQLLVPVERGEPFRWDMIDR